MHKKKKMVHTKQRSISGSAVNSNDRAKHFPYSAYFEGSRVAELAENPSSVLKVQSALDSLTIQ